MALGLLTTRPAAVVDAPPVALVAVWPGASDVVGAVVVGALTATVVVAAAGRVVATWVVVDDDFGEPPVVHPAAPSTTTPARASSSPCLIGDPTVMIRPTVPRPAQGRAHPRATSPAAAGVRTMIGVAPRADDQATQGQGPSRPPARRDALDTTFNVALVLKGLDGVLELAGGVLLLVISPDTLNRWAQALTQHELSQHPNDFLAHHLLRLTENLHKTQLFGAVYLLSHGVVKLVIVGGLLRRALWAYPVAFVFLGGFIVYQIYRLTYDQSVGLALLTAFDLFIIWLTWREYQRTRAKVSRPETRRADASL